MADLDPQFGLLIGAHHVDWAIEQVLKTWQYSYLQEVARVSGEAADELGPFRSWRIAADLERMPEDQTPCCIIANKGIVEPPTRRNYRRPGQSYMATWRYDIGVHVTARGKKQRSAPRAVALAKMYVLAVRAAMVQKRDEYDDPEADIILGMVDWIDENYDELEFDADRTTSLAYASFYVSAHEVTTWGTGPKVPVVPEDPVDPNQPTWPLVTKVVTHIVKVPTDEEVT